VFTVENRKTKHRNRTARFPEEEPENIDAADIPENKIIRYTTNNFNPSTVVLLSSISNMPTSGFCRRSIEKA
jgi:hypothetical protein